MNERGHRKGNTKGKRERNPKKIRNRREVK
jgi:hypothetical protein